MAIRVSVDAAKKDLDNVKWLLAKLQGDVEVITYRAINKSEDNTRVKAVDLISQDLNLTKTRIKKDFKTLRAYKGRLQGTLDSIGDPVGLASFIGTKTLKSSGYVSVKVSKKKGRTHLKHAFMRPGKGSVDPKDGTVRLHVFERVKHWGSSRKALWWLGPREPYRFPLKRLDGPRVEDYYAQHSVLVPVEKYAVERLQINLTNQLDYFLNQYG